MLQHVDIRRNNYVSFWVAIIVNCQAINRIIVAFIPGFTGSTLQVIFLICWLLWIPLLHRKRIKRFSLWLPAVYTIFFGYTYFFISQKMTVSFLYFTCYTVLPFLVMTEEIDVFKVLRYSMYLTAPGILSITSVFPHNYYGGISMGISYAFLPSIVSSIMYVKYYRNSYTGFWAFFHYALFGVNLYYFYQVISFGSRGPALTVIILIAMMFFLKIDIDVDNDQFRFKSIKLFITILIILSFILLFGDEILNWTLKLLYQNSVNIRFIIKNLRLIQADDILNGRGQIISIAIEGIKRAPIFGHGFDLFYNNTGIVYPHNFILQLLYDGGVILTGITCIPMILSSIRILRKHRGNPALKWMFFFIISVPGAMVSLNMWEKYTLWFFLAFCIYEGKK